MLKKSKKDGVKMPKKEAASKLAKTIIENGKKYHLPTTPKKTKK